MSKKMLLILEVLSLLMLGFQNAPVNRYPRDQCTYFAASKRPDVLVFRGHAKDWNNLAEKAGFVVDNKPRAGDVIVFEPKILGADPDYGHVAYVIAVNGKQATIVEINFGKTPEERAKEHTRTITVVTGVSFIHLRDDDRPQPTSMPTATPKLPDLDKSSPASIARWISNMIASGNYASISRLVGSEGALFAGYGHGFEPPGHNNGEEFAKRLGLALANSHPACLGYRLEGDSNNKLYIAFSNARLDEQVTGLQQQENVTLFLFFKNGNRYELQVVVPVDNYGGGEIEYETTNLSACG